MAENSEKFPTLPKKNRVNTTDQKSTYEIPIAARLKGPGPAAYTLPSTIGEKTAHLVAHRSPAYSFGIKLFNKSSEVSPGPNAFFPQTTRTGPPNGPSYSLQAGYKKFKRPGKYNPTFASPHEPKAPAYSIGGRRVTDKKSYGIPGPAEYAINTTLGLHPIITMRAAAAYTIKPPRPKKMEAFSPGPAAYSALDPSKIRKQAPVYSLGARWHHISADAPFTGSGDDGDTTKLSMPGPGKYSPNVTSTKQAPSQYSFRVKHSEYELFVPDVNRDGEPIF
ncbi:hypothetical protein HK099_004547 [Clydaea vesicula]|uniref:Outer dense fiber protein 3 n=1 Tax=Clydaea vesicula TaxID=447962 RepID=A0AAD5U3K0_9FUNG|nr:hypothetical protein HK099_004547 [Clydaea vesicula]